MAEPVHVLELLVEVEPLGPAAQDIVAAVLAIISVAAAIVDLGARIGPALAHAIGNRARPPVEMRIDDVHGKSPQLNSRRRRVAGKAPLDVAARHQTQW